MDNNLSKPGTNAVSFIGVWKDFITLLREAALLAFAILLLAFPATFNRMLVNAGFDQGSFLGFEWKSNLVKSDQALSAAQATITDLSTQNQKLVQALAEAQARINDPAEKAKLAQLDSENLQLSEASRHVQATVQTAIVSNAPLVQKIESAAGSPIEWGVVYGGDTSLDLAKYEVDVIAKKYELTNATVYFRQGSYRSVAVSSDREEAEQLLFRAKNRRGDAYIVNMSKWCPQSVQKNGYSECISQ